MVLIQPNYNNSYYSSNATQIMKHNATQIMKLNTMQAPKRNSRNILEHTYFDYW